MMMEMRDSHDMLRLSVSTIEIEFPNFLEIAYPDCWSNKDTLIYKEYWVSNIIGFSSQYGENGWSANRIRGEPTVYPSYGDISRAWAPRNTGTRSEYLDLEFPELLHMKEIQVYETNNPGGIVKLEAFDAIKKDWVIIFQSEKSLCGTIEASIIQSFKIPFPLISNRVKISIDQNGIPGWYEVDAVKAIGLAVLQPEMNIEAYSLPLPSYLQYAYQSKACSDITLRVYNHSSGEYRDFTSHLMILISRVAYFKNCFNNGLMKSHHTFDFPFPVPDFAAFELLLEWIYTNALNSVIISSSSSSSSSHQPLSDKQIGKEEGGMRVNMDKQITLWYLLFLSQEIGLEEVSTLVQNLIYFRVTRYNAINILRALRTFSAHILFDKTLNALRECTHPFTEHDHNDIPDDLLPYFYEYKIIPNPSEPPPSFNVVAEEIRFD